MFSVTTNTITLGQMCSIFGMDPLIEGYGDIADAPFKLVQTSEKVHPSGWRDGMYYRRIVTLHDVAYSLVIDEDGPAHIVRTYTGA